MKRFLSTIAVISVLLSNNGVAVADGCGAACYQQYLAKMKLCSTDNKACSEAVIERDKCEHACPVPPARSGTVR